MATTGPRYSKEEFARRGEALFEGTIRPELKRMDLSDVVAIDIESGEYEVDADEEVASDRLRARIPDAQIWVRRVGSRYVRHFGASQRMVRS